MPVARCVFGGWPNFVGDDETDVSVFASSNSDGAPVANLRTDDRAIPWHSGDVTTEEVSVWWSTPTRRVSIVMLEDVEASFGTKIYLDLFSTATPGARGTGDLLSVGPFHIWQPFQEIVPWGEFLWNAPPVEDRLAYTPKFAWVALDEDGEIYSVPAKSGRISFTGDNSELGYYGASRLVVSRGWQPWREFDIDWEMSTEPYGAETDRRDGGSDGLYYGSRIVHSLRWSRIIDRDLRWLQAAQKQLGRFGKIVFFPRADDPSRYMREAGSFTFRELAALRGDEGQRTDGPMVGLSLELLEA